MTLRLLQHRADTGARSVIVADEAGAAFVAGVASVRELAARAIADGCGLGEAVARHGRGAAVDLPAELAAGRLLATRTSDRLRLTQARLDEVVSRAAEVSVGSRDTAQLTTEVDDLVLELEAMHQAVQELPRPSGAQ